MLRSFVQSLFPSPLVLPNHSLLFALSQKSLPAWPRDTEIGSSVWITGEDTQQLLQLVERATHNGEFSPELLFSQMNLDPPVVISWHSSFREISNLHWIPMFSTFLVAVVSAMCEDNGSIMDVPITDLLDYYRRMVGAECTSRAGFSLQTPLFIGEQMTCTPLGSDCSDIK